MSKSWLKETDERIAELEIKLEQWKAARAAYIAMQGSILPKDTVEGKDE